MTPTKSNINSSSCNPISSNCVTWEGGDLPVINLCKGDSVSDVIQKVATVLEGVKAELDLTDLDLKCIFDACIACPEPVKTLHNILNLIDAKICYLEDLINTGGGTTPQDPVLTIANCFRFTNSDGDLVTSLAQTEYTKRIGLQVCQILLTIASQQNALDNYESRIAALEAQTHVTPTPQVNSICVLPGSSVATPIVANVDDAWEALERQFCQVKTVLGTATQLTQSIATEPQPSGNPPGIYSLTNPNVTLWNQAANNVATLLSHFGAAISDLRGAVKGILDNCCQITCDDIVVDFDIRLSDDRLTATLFFITKSSIPNGFTDCNATLGTRLTITDSAGNQTFANIKVAQEANNPSGFVIDLSASPIDPGLDYTFSMDACMTNGSTNCMKCVTRTATYKDTCAYCEFSAIGGHGSADGSATIIYEEVGTQIRKTLSLTPGTTGVIKKGSKIIAIAKDGNIILNTTCPSYQDAINNAELYSCYYFLWQVSYGSGSTNAWEAGTLTDIKLFDDSYVINMSIDGDGYSQAIQNALPKGVMIGANEGKIAHTGVHNRYMCFKTTPSIAAGLTLGFSLQETLDSGGFIYRQPPNAGTFNNCPCSTGA